MPERRFPPLLSAPSIVSAIFSLLTVLTGLFLLGNASPFWLMSRDPSMRFAFAILLVVAGFCAVALYIFAAPRIWQFSRRYTPDAQGTQRLPDPLVAACLQDMDFACPSCTYNLRGLKQSTCPECNAPVVVFLYGTQKVSTKWTGLVICWLALTLVASAITLGAVWGAAMDVFSGRGWGYGYRDTEAVVIGLTALAGVLLCGWRAVVLAVPKPPHKQSICTRRTAVWLAAVSAACALAVAIVFGTELLRSWY